MNFQYTLTISSYFKIRKVVTRDYSNIYRSLLAKMIHQSGRNSNGTCSRVSTDTTWEPFSLGIRMPMTAGRVRLSPRAQGKAGVQAPCTVRWGPEGVAFQYLRKHVMRSVNTRLQIFTVTKLRVVVFAVMAPCSLVWGYQRFGGSYCLHFQGKKESSWGFHTFTVIKIHVVVFAVMAPCSLVWGYQSFGGSYCLHFQGKKESSWGFHIFTVIKIHVVIFAVMAPCSLVWGYQSFEHTASIFRVKENQVANVSGFTWKVLGDWSRKTELDSTSDPCYL
jgi:hypothetical protein